MGSSCGSFMQCLYLLQDYCIWQCKRLEFILCFKIIANPFFVPIIGGVQWGATPRTLNRAVNKLKSEKQKNKCFIEHLKILAGSRLGYIISKMI